MRKIIVAADPECRVASANVHAEIEDSSTIPYASFGRREFRAQHKGLKSLVSAIDIRSFSIMEVEWITRALPRVSTLVA